jgi:hypothetical protein
VTVDIKELCGHERILLVRHISHHVIEIRDKKRIVYYDDGQQKYEVHHNSGSDQKANVYLRNIGSYLDDKDGKPSIKQELSKIERSLGSFNVASMVGTSRKTGCPITKEDIKNQLPEETDTKAGEHAGNILIKSKLKSNFDVFT